MEKNYQRNRKGCMLMFINIFGSNQKRLLMDNKRASKRISVNNDKESVEKLNEEEDIDVPISVDEHEESEEKFKEIIKRLIAQKEGEIQTCKDLLEAFHVLDSKEESFMKKISHEDTQSLGDSKRVEEEVKPEVVSKQESIVIPKRKGKFFSKKWKLQERRNKSQVAKTIVVLKPGPSCLDVDSSTGLHSTSNKSKTARTFSRFLIGLIKRRLQSAVGKKSCDVSVDMRQNCSIQSKSRNHVSDEEESFCNESEDSKKIMSSLYVAAKKHLSEMLANGDIDVSLTDKEVPRILGKILSLPEFSSPTNSPRLSPAHGLVSDLNTLSQTTEKPKILQCNSEASELIDEDSDKYDETLFTIDVSVPTDNGKEIQNIDNEEKSLIKEIFNQAHSLTSPPESPASSSVRMTDCKETAIDVQGKLSPVSVLEPLFTDDDCSPTTSTRFSSAEMRMQPLCIRFDEVDPPKPDNSNNVKTTMDDKEVTFAYIEAIVKTSGLSWEELLTRPFYSEQILETESTNDIVFCSTQLCDDKNLLEDCINEVLIDFCKNEFNPGPWISFLKPEVQLISDMEIAVKVAQEGVYWHLLPLTSPHTLDQIVKKDMAKAESWMDLRFEIGCIGSYTGEVILDELVEEIITSCRDMVQAEPLQDQNNNNVR